MFDTGASSLVEDGNKNTPRNVITLTNEFHDSFGEFGVYFEPVLDQKHIYLIKSIVHPVICAGFPSCPWPRARPLIRLSPRLLAIHRALAHIIIHFMQPEATLRRSVRITRGDTSERHN